LFAISIYTSVFTVKNLTLSKTEISITCDFEEDGDDETTEYDILSYAKTYLEPKQQELQTIWTQKMEEIQKYKRHEHN